MSKKENETLFDRFQRSGVPVVLVPGVGFEVPPCEYTKFGSTGCIEWFSEEGAELHVEAVSPDGTVLLSVFPPAEDGDLDEQRVLGLSRSQAQRLIDMLADAIKHADEQAAKK
ncbi:MAG: hypothetical protein QOC62_1779 [Mycobacterium sp.]|nr:hypothetical protein [Mycobacterium sp.]